MRKSKETHKEYQKLNLLYINIIRIKQNICQKQKNGKRLGKIIQKALLIFYVLKKKKYTLLIFQNITQPMKNR